ncbi:MAG: hypothetical protein ACRCZB_04825, partial [Bacteroidales bacterium]
MKTHQTIRTFALPLILLASCLCITTTVFAKKTQNIEIYLRTPTIDCGQSQYTALPTHTTTVTPSGGSIPALPISY